MISPAYVVNVRAKGKVHLSNGHEDKGTHRVKCGWYIMRSTSLVFKCHSLKYGQLCKKCFKEDDSARMKSEDNEEVEQFNETPSHIGEEVSLEKSCSAHR